VFTRDTRGHLGVVSKASCREDCRHACRESCRCRCVDAKCGSRAVSDTNLTIVELYQLTHST